MYATRLKSTGEYWGTNGWLVNSVAKAFQYRTKTEARRTVPFEVQNAYEVVKVRWVIKSIDPYGDYYYSGREDGIYTWDADQRLAKRFKTREEAQAFIGLAWAEIAKPVAVVRKCST